MFGIGWTEFVIIALVLLVFVGPRNLPPLLRKLGTVMSEFKSASRELRNQIDLESEGLESPRTVIRDFGRELLRDVPDPYEEVRAAEESWRETERELRRDVHDVYDVKEEDQEAPSEPEDKDLSGDGVSRD